MATIKPPRQRRRWKRNVSGSSAFGRRLQGGRKPKGSRMKRGVPMRWTPRAELRQRRAATQRRARRRSGGRRRTRRMSSSRRRGRKPRPRGREAMESRAGKPAAQRGQDGQRGLQGCQGETVEGQCCHGGGACCKEKEARQSYGCYSSRYAIVHTSSKR